MIIKYTILLLTISFTTLAFSMTTNEQLLQAAEKGDSQEVKEALSHGANVNAQDNDHKTALIWAAQKGHTNIVQLLIDNGANVNNRDKYGQTALMYAAWNGHRNTVKLLIANNADLNAKNKIGITPLIRAARGYNDMEKIDSLKITMNLWAETCKDRQDITKLLAAAGADLTGLEKYPNWYKLAHSVQELFKAAKEDNLDKVKEILTLMPALYLQNKDGNTLLHIALLRGNEELTTYLLRYLAYCKNMLSIKNKHGETPVNLAIGNNYLLALILGLEP